MTITEELYQNPLSIKKMYYLTSAVYVVRRKDYNIAKNVKGTRSNDRRRI